MSKSKKVKYSSEEVTDNSIEIYCNNGNDIRKFCEIVSDHDSITQEDRSNADLIVDALNAFDPF